MEKMLMIVSVFVFFLVLFSVQYTLNKIFVVLKRIEENTRGGRIRHDDDNN